MADPEVLKLLEELLNETRLLRRTVAAAALAAGDNRGPDRSAPKRVLNRAMQEQAMSDDDG